MKLRMKDKVLVISGRDKGKTGEILKVFPIQQTALVEGVHMMKKHRKPTQADPRGGIVEITKPIALNKLQILDPKSGKPARVGYKIDEKGKKERIFKVASFSNKKAAAKKSTTQPAEKKPAKKGATS